jgi:hypothetical protein
MVGGDAGQVPQPAVMVTGATHCIVMHVEQTCVVDTTAGHPDTDSIVGVAVMPWLSDGAALGFGLG